MLDKVNLLHLLVNALTLLKTTEFTPLWAMGKGFVLARLRMWQIIVICLRAAVSLTMLLYSSATTNTVLGTKMLTQTVVSLS